MIQATSGLPALRSTGGQIGHVRPAPGIADKGVEKDGVHPRIAEEGRKRAADDIGIVAGLPLHRRPQIDRDSTPASTRGRALPAIAWSMRRGRPWQAPARRRNRWRRSPPRRSGSERRPGLTLPAEGFIRASDRQRSIICLKSRASVTPAWARAPVMIRWFPASDAVWLSAASAPCRLLPPLSTTIGFALRRHSSRKRRPSEKDSR